MVDLNRRLLRDVDWITLLAAISLTIFGCLGIYSSAPQADHWKKQLIFLVIGIIAACVIAVTDYRQVIGTLAPALYIATLVLLGLVFTRLGVTINANRAWLGLGGFSLQPSELAKLTTILMLARYLQQPRPGSLPIKDILVMGGIVLPPVILIYLENDTGTMLTFGAIFGAFCFLGGVRKLYIALAIVAVVVGLIAVYPHLKPYQKA